LPSSLEFWQMGRDWEDTYWVRKGEGNLSVGDRPLLREGDLKREKSLTIRSNSEISREDKGSRISILSGERGEGGASSTEKTPLLRGRQGREGRRTA